MDLQLPESSEPSSVSRRPDFVLEVVPTLEERRRSLRAALPFPALVRGVDIDGKDFSLETVLDDVGGNGLYVRIPYLVGKGVSLNFVIRLSTDTARSALRVALRGPVLRVEAQADGLYGVAVVFTHQRFLYAKL